MTRAVFAAGALALAWLTACTPNLEDMGGLAPEIQEADEADKGVTERMADDLLGITSTPEARAVRLCMIEASIVEVMTYRVTKFDSAYAPTALGQIALLEGVLERFDPAGVFADTDAAQAALQIDRVLIDIGRDRVPRLLSALTGGINLLAVAERARIVAGQGRLLAALIRDTQALLKAIETGQATAEFGMSACRARIEWNATQVDAVLGRVKRPAVQE